MSALSSLRAARRLPCAFAPRYRPARSGLPPCDQSGFRPACRMPPQSATRLPQRMPHDDDNSLQTSYKIPTNPHPARWRQRRFDFFRFVKAPAGLYSFLFHDDNLFFPLQNKPCRWHTITSRTFNPHIFRKVSSLVTTKKVFYHEIGRP